MGPQGLFFYMHTMTKALTAYGVDEPELMDGSKLNWRKEVAMRLINLQQKDGSWQNENGRWWERDRVGRRICGLTLEMIQRRM